MIISISTKFNGTVRTVQNIHRQTVELPFLRWLSSTFLFLNTIKPAADENAALFGTRKEKACAPVLNSGLFTAMKEMGDIEGVFVGHDHDNDYAVMWQGILLAYGRYTGGNTVYNNLSNGARIIELTEGEKGFRTWIRTKNHTEQEVKFPESFLKPNK